MKRCPYCAEEIRDEAVKCRYCGSFLTPEAVAAAGQPPPGGALPTPPDQEALQYTHSGQRYLLGYGRGFFGIWDRQMPGAPIARFPRTDEGWREAWLRFSAEEPHSSEVGIGGSATPAAAPVGAGLGAAPPRRINGAWWLLPILLGWLGGLIAWAVNRDADPRTARNMLVTGIAISLVGFLLILSAGGFSPGP